MFAAVLKLFQFMNSAQGRRLLRASRSISMMLGTLGEAMKLKKERGGSFNGKLEEVFVIVDCTHLAKGFDLLSIGGGAMSPLTSIFVSSILVAGLAREIL